MIGTRPRNEGGRRYGTEGSGVETRMSFEMSSDLMSEEDRAALAEMGIMWVMRCSRSTDVDVGLLVDGSVVPVTLRIDWSKARLSSGWYMMEIERCVNEARAMLVGSF